MVRPGLDPRTLGLKEVCGGGGCRAIRLCMSFIFTEEMASTSLRLPRLDLSNRDTARRVVP